MANTKNITNYTTICDDGSSYLRKELTGEQFNELTKNNLMFKFLNNDLKHHGMEYKIGHNSDCLPFNPTYGCRSGGLYFVDELHILRWLDLFDIVSIGVV